jgi:hypothetical protein
MVILYMYDKLNGYRYRKIGYDYYEVVKNNPMIISAWMVK